MIGWISRPPTSVITSLPVFFSAQPALDDLRSVARELDRPVVAEEVGRVEHVDVERVAFDPLAAVQKPPQHADRLGDLDAADLLHRVDRAHLVRDGADAADARRDVRRLEEGAPAEHRLEEPRRLEDPELDVLDVAVREADGHRALALDSGEVVRSDRPALSHSRAASRNAGAFALKVRKTRSRLGSSMPSTFSCRVSERVFGVSIGPKQP